MALRVAVIGAGQIARRAHLPGYVRARAEVVALCSKPEPGLAALADEYGIRRRYHDWRQMLADGGFDAVSICTPPALHAEMAIECARHGCHVLVEKPMALTAAECDAMIAAAAGANRLLMVAHNQRYVGHHQHARQVLTSGRIGRPYLAHAVFGHGGPEHWSPQQDWYFEPGQAGPGVLADLGSHKLDLLCWLLDQRIVEVAALGLTVAKPTSASDTVVLAVRFDGGALATIQVSWVFQPDWENSLVIRCERGVIRVPTELTEPVRVLEANQDGSREFLLTSETDDPAGWLATVAAFVRAVTERQSSPIDGDAGRAVVVGVQAAYEAMSQHRVVHL